MDASFFKEALKNYESTKENKGNKSELEICTYNTEEYKQIVLNEKTGDTVEGSGWLDLIGAKITRIREEEYPEHHIVFTLSLKED